MAGGWEKLWVVTSSQFVEYENSSPAASRKLMAEPEGRDTAPAVAWICP